MIYWNAIQSLAALATVILLVLGLRLQRDAARWQRDAAEAALATVEASERAQRIASRPALSVTRELRALFPGANNSPVYYVISVQNVGHGTAVLERVQFLNWSKVSLDYGNTDGREIELLESFGTDVFLKLVGVSPATVPAKIMLSALSEHTRALEVAGSFELVRIDVAAEHQRLISDAFRNLSVNVLYGSLAGEQFDLSNQFSALRAA